MYYRVYYNFGLRAPTLVEISMSGFDTARLKLV